MRKQSLLIAVTILVALPVNAQYLTVLWSSCAVPALNITASDNFYDSGRVFHYLYRCAALDELTREQGAYTALPTSVNPSAPCFAPLSARVSEFSNASSSSSDCDGASQAITAALLCGAGSGNLAAVVASVPAFVASVASASRPCSSALGALRLQLALNFSYLPSSERTVSFSCSTSQVSLAACDAQYSELQFPSFPQGQCDAAYGVSFNCSYCQPYFDPNVITQPYLFLVFPGMKLVLIKLFELFVLFKLMEKWRTELEHRLHNRTTPTGIIPEGFVAYVTRVLLRGGQMRIQERLTRRHMNGKANCESLLKKFKKYRDENGITDPDLMPELTGEEMTQLLDEKGIVLHNASYHKSECVKPCLSALHECGIAPGGKNSDGLCANEILDWFYFDVCMYGARRVILNTDAQRTDLLGSVRAQLELMRQQASLAVVGQRALNKGSAVTTAAPKSAAQLPLIENSDRGTEEFREAAAFQQRDEADGASEGKILSVDGQQARSSTPAAAAQIDMRTHRSATVSVGGSGGTPAHATGHRMQWHLAKPRKHTSTMNVLHTFINDVFVVNEASSTNVVQVALRPTVPIPGDIKEHLIVCEDTVTLLRIADTIAHALARRNTVEDSVAIVRVTLYVAGTVLGLQTPLDLTQSVRDVMEPEESRLCLRFRAEISKEAPHEVVRGDNVLSAIASQSEAGIVEHCLDKYNAITVEIEQHQESYAKIAQTEPATFDAEKLQKDTEEALSRILDDRFSTTRDEFFVSLCGPDAVYECDITNAERYAVRDSIPQLTTDLEATLRRIKETNIDPRITYNRCFDYLTAYKMWNGNVRHSCMRVFHHQEARVEKLLSSMFADIEERLILEDIPELDEDCCRALAGHLKSELLDMSLMVPIVLIKEQVITSVFAVNTYVMIVTVLYAVILFVTSLVDGVTEATGWDAYEQSYFRYLNSGSAATTVYGAVVNWFMNAEQRHQSKFFTRVDVSLIVVSTLLIAPPLITHILPGLFAYCWLAFGCIGILCVPLFILARGYYHLEQRSTDGFIVMTEQERLHQRKIVKWYLVGLILIFVFIILGGVVVLFQSSFNWAYLLYRDAQLGLDYISVLTFEEEARSLQCYWTAVLVSVYSNLQWLSSVV